MSMEGNSSNGTLQDSSFKQKVPYRDPDCPLALPERDINHSQEQKSPVTSPSKRTGASAVGAGDNQPGGEKSGAHIAPKSDLETLVLQFAHKLNNHLTLILGYGQLSLNEAGETEKRRVLEKIVEETLNASQIVRDLADTVRQPQK